VFAIIAVAATYGKDAFADGATYDYSGFVYAAVIISCLSLVLAGIALLIVMKFPETMIKVSLIFVVILAGISMIFAFYIGSLFGGIMAAVFFAISVWYAKSVWPRIPFAAVNMSTAIAAIRANFGVTLFAFLFPILGVFWTIIWVIAFTGVMEQQYSDDPDNSSAVYGYLFLLFLSMFFTEQVLENSVQVTVSGVVGTWWVAPEDNGFCSAAVCNSFIRTMTTSFGSICFGSLLVAIIRALKALAQQARQNGDGGIGACIAECILGCLASLVECKLILNLIVFCLLCRLSHRHSYSCHILSLHTTDFNKWAFVYVGIYGFSYFVRMIVEIL
jgi:hypothetical protein